MRSMLMRASSILALFSLSTLFSASHALAGGPPDSWSNAASMNVARQGHAVAIAGGNVVVIGGCTIPTTGMTTSDCQPGASTGIYLNSTERYTAGGNDSWTLFPNSMQSSRAWHTATTLLPNNGKTLILVTGGIGGATPGVLASAELYDPSTNTSTSTGSMNEPRAWHTATLLPNGQVLIVGGITSLPTTVSTKAEIYDPKKGTFTLTTDPSFSFLRSSAPISGRAYHTALALTSGALLAGGLGTSGTPLATIETFDSVEGFILSAGTLNTARAFHTATLVGTGPDVALFIGGRDGSGMDLNSAETWSGTVTLLPSMIGASPESHTATQLPSGKVLVAGGLSGDSTSRTSQFSSELWDPNTKMFTTTRGSLTDARAFHVAVSILSINRVLVAGGQGGTTGAPFTLSSVELYRPAVH